MTAAGHYDAGRLRRGAAQFLAGKLFSAALTFTAFTLAARLLGVIGYGHYATLVAALELFLALSTVGMDWAGARYVPEYRIHAAGGVLAAFIRRVAGVQWRLQLLLALSAAAATISLGWAHRVGGPVAVGLVAALLVVEGLGRMLRDQFLAVLMAQAWAQAAAVTRGAVFAGLLLVVTRESGDLLVQVLLAEVAAATCALVVGAAGLARVLRQHRPDAASASAATASAWRPPTWAQVRAVARDAMFNTWLVLPAGGPVLTLVARALAGAEAAAAFGFVRGLVDQIRRFLPAELFLSLVRAAVVARYTTSRDAVALSRQLALVVIGSLLALCPLLALILGQPVAVLRLAGGSSFSGAGLTLAVWSLGLWLFSLRRVSEVMAYTVNLSRACLVGGVVLATAPLWMAATLLLGGPLPLALAASLLADMGFTLVVGLQLAAAGFLPPAPVANLARLVGLQALVALAVALAAAAGLQPPQGTAWLALLALLGTVALVPLLQPLRGHPRALLWQLAPRWRFPC